MYTRIPTNQPASRFGDPPAATAPGRAPPSRATRKIQCSPAQLLKVNQILGKSLRADEVQLSVQRAVEGAAGLARGGALPIDSQRAALFEAVFGVPATWRPAGAQWMLGGVVRKRMALSARLLSGGSLWISCFGWSWGGLGPDAPDKYLLRATENTYRIALGALYWEAVRDDRSPESGLLGGALRIGFGRLIQFSPGAATKNLSYCYMRYALHLAGRQIPNWVGAGCPIPPARWNRLMPTPTAPTPPAPAPATTSTAPIRLRLTDEELARVLGHTPKDPLSARLDWIISQVPPTPAARPPLKDLVRKAFDERLDQAMNRAGVPKRLQPYVRRAAHGALERGSKLVLEESLHQLGVTSPQAVDAIRQVIDRIGQEAP